MNTPILYGGFTIRTVCDCCGRSVLPTEPVLKSRCPHCHRAVRIDAAFYQYLLGTVPSGRIHKSPNRIEEVSMNDQVFGQAFLSEAPRCASCGTAFAASGVLDGDEDIVPCTACGKTMFTQPAPDWMKLVSPNATRIFTSVRTTEKETVGSDTAPLALFCPECGASLTADVDTRRIAACDHCAAEVYLPDALWLRLHPVKTAMEWFVRFEGAYVEGATPDEEEGDQPTPEENEPSAPRYIGVTAKTHCPECGEVYVMKGPSRQGRCLRCQTLFPMVLPQLATSVKESANAYSRLKWREGSKITFNESGFSWELVVSRLKPACVHCGERVSVDHVETGRDGSFECPFCGGKTRTSLAPKWLRRQYPDIVQVFGGLPENETDAKAPAASEALESVRFACPACNGFNRFTRLHARVFACEYCGLQIFVGEDLWRNFHPAERSGEFVLRLERGAVPPSQEPEVVTSRLDPKARLREAPDSAEALSVRYSRFRWHTECTACGGTLPIEGPFEEVTCSSCRTLVKLPIELFEFHLQLVENRYDELKWGQGIFNHWSNGAFQVISLNLKADPRCDRCEAHLPEAESVLGNEVIACASCGAKMYTGPAPDFLRALVPAAEQVFTAVPLEAATETVPNNDSGKTTPVALACENCGAPLRVDGAVLKEIVCGACGENTAMPAELRRHFHPDARIRPWFVRFSGPTEAERKQLEEQKSDEALENRIGRDAKLLWASAGVALGLALGSLLLFSSPFIFLTGALTVGPMVFGLMCVRAIRRLLDPDSPSKHREGFPGLCLFPVVGIVLDMIFLWIDLAQRERYSRVTRFRAWAAAMLLGISYHLTCVLCIIASGVIETASK